MKISNEILIEFFGEEAEDMLSIPDADDAIIGVTEIIFPDGDVCNVITYSRCKLVETLMREYDISEDETKEYIQFNVENCYSGKYTPIIVDDMIKITE